MAKFIYYFLCACLICNVTYASSSHYIDTFSIESIEGKNEKIIILNNCSEKELQIIYHNDTICIFDDFYCNVNTTSLNKNFLQVEYDVSGGSALHNKHLLLAYIKNQKLYIPFNTLSEIAFYGSNEKYLYKIKLKIDHGLNNEHFRLNVIVHKKYQSENSPKTEWYNYKKNLILTFDNKNNIFYNSINNLRENIC